MDLVKKMVFLFFCVIFPVNIMENKFMAGIKNKEILLLLKADIKKSKYTQAEIAEKLGIKPPFLSRQLNGRDPLSLDRAYSIEKILGHSDNRDKVYELLKKEINSSTDEEKNDGLLLNMIQAVESIGRDSYLSFILDFWRDMSGQDKQQVFRIFLDFVENKQNERNTGKK